MSVSNRARRHLALPVLGLLLLSLMGCGGGGSFAVGPTGNLLVANDDGYVGPAGGTLEVAAAQGVLANDLGVDLVVAETLTTSAGGRVMIRPDGSFVYTAPPGGFTGNDTFQYRAGAFGLGPGPTVRATVTIGVGAAFQARPDSYVTQVDLPLNVAAAFGLFVNDTPPLALSTFDATSTNGGTVAVMADGSFAYTPPRAFNGIDTFQYTIRLVAPGTPVLSTATVTIGVQDAPLAVDDPGNTTPKDTAVAVAVLANDLDADGTIDPTTVTVVTPPASGGTSVDPVTGEVTYTPAAGFTGVVTFQYTVRDDDGNLSNVATVTIAVTNQTPVAVDDPGNMATVGVPLVIAVLANDSDADGTLVPASVTVTSVPSSGIISLNPVTGAITYTASIGGADSFTYTVDDDDGATSNTATVSVVSNVPPVAVDDDAGYPEGPLEIDVLDNDFDPDGTLDPTTVTIVTPPDPAQGVVTVDPATGVITFTPSGGFFGTFFTYTVNDDLGATSNLATVAVGDVAPP